MNQLDDLLIAHEGKNLEFKENAKSPLNIIKTVIAFANTSGGIIVIGVKDKNREPIGVENILQEEERLANIISDSIEPLLIPDIEIVNHKNKELLVINVPYLVGPYYYKTAGLEKGIFIRLGSTNRIADKETISYLHRLAKQISFDEMPCVGASLNELDDDLILEILHPYYKNIAKNHYKSIGLVAEHQNKFFPTYGGILLFGKNRFKWFPDSIIRCVCFGGTTREKIIDQKDITNNLIQAIEECIKFIYRHSNLRAIIKTSRREDIAQFPTEAVREIAINSIVHADYAMKGSEIQIAVFADRIEFTNPGGLPFGQTIESALSGVSRMRNRVIGKIFRELKLIERLGSGLPRVIEIYRKQTSKMPIIEEINTHFRVTLFEVTVHEKTKAEWETKLIESLSKGESLSTKQIAVLWNVTDRTARTRLKSMVENGWIKRQAKSINDPNAIYSIKL